MQGRFEQLKRSQRLLIAVGGIPGSGKTTLATLTVNKLNQRYSEKHPILAAGSGGLVGTGPTHPIAALIPMDGYHLTREQLSAMPDPTTAHARRGAAFTFDSKGYLELVKQLRAPITPELGSVFAPTFDHAVKDPVANGVEVARGVKVVVFEGNYVALDDIPGEAMEGEDALAQEGSAWAQAKGLMDEVWFVEVSEDVARRRLIRRHVAAGIEKDDEAARKRADANDLVNGREIERRRGKVDEVVTSKEDATWAPENKTH